MDEVEILEGEGLQEYMIELMEEQLQTARERLVMSKMMSRTRTVMSCLI